MTHMGAEIQANPHYVRMKMLLLLILVTTIICSASGFSPHAFTSLTPGQKAKQSPSILYSSGNTAQSTTDETTDHWYSQWIAAQGVTLNPKITIREPLAEERGKGGVETTESIHALEVLARIPKSLVVTATETPTRALEAAAQAKNFSWAADLTAAALVALHPTEEEKEEDGAVAAKQEWIQSWKSGGWATDAADLGPDDVNFGAKDVIGSLMATGSDNDANIYAKFRMPCHPVVLRSSIGLAVLTGCSEDEARISLTCRGSSYRSMRDALEPLVLTPSKREKGSQREHRCWDVADLLSRVLARATLLEDVEESTNNNNNAPPAYAAIVPIHERLAHCTRSEGGVENSRLVASDDSLLLVATRDIPAGQPITRDYTTAPQLDPDEESHGALRLLLQFGLPSTAW